MVRNSREEIAATGHTEVEVAQIDPTCEEDGCTAGVKCSVCDEILRGCQTITALGHVEVTDAAVGSNMYGNRSYRRKNIAVYVIRLQQSRKL